MKNLEFCDSKNNIYFSNNQNEFFAIDERNGVIKWKQTLNSNLRPTFADGLIFTVTLEGYLAVIDSRNGNILRMTSIFGQIKNFKKKKKYNSGGNGWLNSWGKSIVFIFKKKN